MKQAKPFEISKRDVVEAFEKVKANKGAEGIDDETIEDFEANLKDNLYKIWNRMSSGTYFPPPVRVVEIPKSDGTMRKLGIPTVSDRVAQQVVKMNLEPILEPKFHVDSYGYRPRKTMEQALAATRQRCWKYDWVIDLDIKGFFDNMDHDLVMKAVRICTDSRWMLMYIERWLKAPAQQRNGTLTPRTKGTPQGGVISPLLANLFMHYAFDEWMRKRYPKIPFARFADDVVVHCESLEEAEALLAEIKMRLKHCKLELHPVKTKITYCKDDGRKGNYQNEKFDFLGYTFRIREARNCKGQLFMGFLPAISDKAKKKIRTVVGEENIHLHTDRDLKEIAEELNPKIRGWMNHYGLFYKSELDEVLKCIDDDLAKWALRKYKKLKNSLKRARTWISKIAKRDPKLFAHWKRFGVGRAV